MTAKEQNKLAGIFLLIHGGLQLVFMFALGIVYAGIGAAVFATARKGEDQFAGLAIAVIMIIVVLFSLIFVIPQILGGWKMIKGGANARTWGIIGSIISCMSFPLGTAAGVFGLIFLFGDAGRQFYLGTSNPAQHYPPQPPPPSSWQ